MTTVINVYDKAGLVVDQIEIDDDITLTSERVSKGKEYYYKGVGVKYFRHHIADPDILEYNILEKSSVPYLGWAVVKNSFVDKEGIFQELYQPHMASFIGACDATELGMIENSMFFERSSVKVVNSYNFDKFNQQYYFKLIYDCDRKKYLDYGDPVKLNDLLHYMIPTGWNFVWDKTSIRDISFDGRVTDVADIYHSNQLSATLGSVYSVLYSLGNLDNKKYKEFLDVAGLTHENRMSYVINAIKLISHHRDVSELTNSSYENVVLNYLVNGKNCGDCCNLGLGYDIRKAYIQSTRKAFGLDSSTG